MNRFEEYEQQRTVNLLGLRAFPRSVGMLVGAVTLLLTLDPINSLLVCIVSWFVAYIIKSLLPPSIVDTYLWSCCSLPVNAIGAYPIRWLLYITRPPAATQFTAKTRRTRRRPKKKASRSSFLRGSNICAREANS